MAEAKKIVLLVEDEKLLADVYETKLKQAGFDVVSAYMGEKALNMLRNGLKPDVILFDITMPQSMSGYELLEHIVAEKLSPHSFKIALTNQSNDGEFARTRELGAHDHWLKAELSPADIVAKVTELLKGRT